MEVPRENNEKLQSVLYVHVPRFELRIYRILSMNATYSMEMLLTCIFSLSLFLYIYTSKTKLRGLSLREKQTERATAACRKS